MKTKEERNALKEEVGALNKKLTELTDDEMQQVAGGILSMTNPVAGMPREQAEKIAAELDKGHYEGAFSTMTGAQFMAWWAETNDEYNFRSEKPETP